MTVTRIPVPTPFPMGDTNTYLLHGQDDLTLVDCGPATEAAWAALCQGLRGAGYRVEQVRRLVLSHSHLDHAGLAGRVQRASGCQVLAHPVDHARLCGDPDAWGAMAEFRLDICRLAGAPAAVLPVMADNLEAIRRYADPVAAVEGLADGDCLSVAGGAWQVLATPGHARGALCLYQAQQRLLLSGDTLLPHIVSNAFLEGESAGRRNHPFLQYLDSLERLDALDTGRVYPGHGEPFADPGSLIRARRTSARRLGQKVLALVRAGLECPWDLARKLYHREDPEWAFLAVSAAVGHLDLLVGDGEIAWQDHASHWRVAPVPCDQDPLPGVARDG